MKKCNVIALILDALFTKQTPEREFGLRVSYLEIYNEESRDLLCPTSTKLEIREDHAVSRVPFVFGLCCVDEAL